MVFAFESGLRIISFWTKDESGKSKYPLLSPIYFCAIPPFFYACAGTWWFVSGQSLGDEFFFPPLTECKGNDCNAGVARLWGDNVWDIFQIIDFSSISWAAVIRSIPTMIALVMFSLIHGKKRCWRQVCRYLIRRLIQQFFYSEQFQLISLHLQCLPMLK